MFGPHLCWRAFFIYPFWGHGEGACPSFIWVKGTPLNELPDHWGSFGLLVKWYLGDAQKLLWHPTAGTPSGFCPGLDPRTLRFPGPVQLLCVSSTNTPHYPASGLDPAHAVSKRKNKKRASQHLVETRLSVRLPLNCDKSNPKPTLHSSFLAWQDFFLDTQRPASAGISIQPHVRP